MIYKNLLISLLLVFFYGCSTSTKLNVEVDTLNNFNIDNYNDFYININAEKVSAEINPLDLEKVKFAITNALIDRGLSESKQASIEFKIMISTKDEIESDPLRSRYSYYYWDPYYRNDIRTISKYFLRINIKDLKEDKIVWTIVTGWRSGSSNNPISDDGLAILIDEIMTNL